MSLVVDSNNEELTTNELLIAILAELQVMNMHLEQTTDTQFTTDDVDDGHNLN